MRPIGFSTGALALGDFVHALELLSTAAVEVVELSALRARELPLLLAGVASLDLDPYRYVSVHAPSHFPAAEEAQIVRWLRGFAERGWPIVAHPDTLRSVSEWRAFGPTLLIENMDKRKPVGRSAAELDAVFELLPEAGFCFDLGHARQFDPSMMEAQRIMSRHGSRLREVHLSEVSTASKHTRLSFGAIHDFQEVAHRIPLGIPIVLESPVAADGIAAEIARAREALQDRALAVA